MAIQEFKYELLRLLYELSYIKQVKTKFETLKVINFFILLPNTYHINIFFNSVKNSLSFTLLHKNRRIWGLDKDNRIGWHVHPLHQTEKHQLIKPHSLSEIIARFDMIWQELQGQ